MQNVTPANKEPAKDEGNERNGKKLSGHEIDVADLPENTLTGDCQPERDSNRAGKQELVASGITIEEFAGDELGDGKSTETPADYYQELKKETSEAGSDAAGG